MSKILRSLIFGKFRLNIILILQISFSVLLINLTATLVLDEVRVLNDYNELFKKNVLYFQRDLSELVKTNDLNILHDNSYFKSLTAKFDGIEITTVNNYVIESSLLTNKSNLGMLKSYPSMLTSNIPMYKKLYEDGNEISDGKIPVLVTKGNHNFSKGDLIQVNFLNGLDKQEVDLYVVDIISSKVKYFDLSSSGTNVSLSNMMIEYDSIFNETPLFFCLEKDISQLSSLINSSDINRLIHWDGDPDQLINELKNNGLVVSFQEISSNSWDLVKIMVYRFLPQAVFVLIVTIIGLIGISIVFQSLLEKELAIYLMCGISKKDILNIERIYSSVILAISMFVFYTFSNILQLTIKIDTINLFQSFNIIITFGYLCMFMLIISVIQQVALNRGTIKTKLYLGIDS